jgi:uncharacterized protein (DUF433 family)
MATLEIVAEKPPLVKDKDGVFRVGGTRVRLDTVIAAYLNGCTPETIQDKYPSLTLPDIYAVVTYYLRHEKEMDDYLALRRPAIEEAEREMEERFPSANVRERLIARRTAKA